MQESGHWTHIELELFETTIHVSKKSDVLCILMLIFVVDSTKEHFSLFQISENADPTFC